MLSLVVMHAAVQRLMGVVLVLLGSLDQQQQQQLQRDGGLQLPDNSSQDFVAGVVLNLLTTPDLVTSLPAATKVRGQQYMHCKHSHQRCLHNLCIWCGWCPLFGCYPGLCTVCVGQQCAECALVCLQARLLAPSVMYGHLLPTAQQLASTGALAGLPAAHCLANIAQLLTGCAASVSGGTAQQAAVSTTLAQPQVATAYVHAAVQLLVASRRQEASPSRHSPQGSAVDRRSVADVLQEGCWMLGTQQHLMPLLQVLQQDSTFGMVLWAGYCCHLLQDAGSKAPNSQGLGGSVLNVLAFAPKLLPFLWEWLAHSAGLPLQAPLQASRGLDIAAVACGAEGLAPGVTLVMGLFCRCAAVHACMHMQGSNTHEVEEHFCGVCQWSQVLCSLLQQPEVIAWQACVAVGQ